MGKEWQQEKWPHWSREDHWARNGSRKSGHTGLEKTIGQGTVAGKEAEENQDKDARRPSATFWNSDKEDKQNSRRQTSVPQEDLCSDDSHSEGDMLIEEED